jgi:pimeloyl-ACP methyl ester carboxylesterase
MVLVDSSHEGQQQLIGPLMPWEFRLLESLTVPLLYVDRRSKMRNAVRRSMTRELRALNQQTQADAPLRRGDLGDKPLVVLTRPPDKMMPVSRGWDVWHDLQEQAAELSRNHRHLIAAKSGHYIHLEDPELVIQSIRDVIESARSGSPLPSVAHPT